jgi:CRP-like cAMP-binding protein
MPKSRPTTKTTPPKAGKPADGDGRGNLILLTLAASERTQLLPSLELVRLKLHQVLYEAGDAIRSLYFMNSGLASVFTVQSDGRSVEVGLIGKEGFVGLPVAFGFKTTWLRVMIQTDATAYRVDVSNFRKMLPQCPDLARRLQHYEMMSSMQSTQLAACNRLHDVAERLARWLLMSHDRIGAEVMPLTQEFLGQMLGAPRSSVSIAASMLQKAGMITYTRGNVTILDRSKLATAACECYQIMQDNQSNWHSEVE